MSANNPNNPNDPTKGGNEGEGFATNPFGAGGQASGGSEGEGLVTNPYGSGGGQASGGGAATGTAAALAQKAREYGQNVADAATTAKEYVVERAGVVGDKIQDLRNKDYQQVAQEAKEYARQNPGQALLISAAAGFVLGLLLRGSRR